MTFDWEGATHNWQLYWFKARKEYMRRHVENEAER
jgi:hypothetical protein